MWGSIINPIPTGGLFVPNNVICFDGNIYALVKDKKYLYRETSMDWVEIPSFPDEILIKEQGLFLKTACTCDVNTLFNYGCQCGGY